MPRYKLTIEYNGRPYAGWQKQPDNPTIQGALENAAYHFCGQEVDIVGAGRTDSGVHAVGQIAHIDLNSEIDEYKVMQGINYYLFNQPSDFSYPENRITVTNAELVNDKFHARFSAKKRVYVYRIINRRTRLGLELGRAWHVAEELDEKAMQAGADLLIGHHDFSSFRDAQCQAKSPVKTVECFDVKRTGNEIQCTIMARSFLHHQVRIMVGTLGLVGKGKWKPEDVNTALETANRDAAGPTAPPDGLYFVRVDY